MKQGPYAHSLPGKSADQWEELGTHLHHVAALAAARAEPFGWAAVANAAGLLHDIGKTSAQFQAYIRGLATSGGDHATAGAREATAAYSGPLGDLLALVIAGHHSGLANPDDLTRRLASDLPDYSGWQQHSGPLPDAASLRPKRPMPSSALPGVGPQYSQAFLVRMLFSCLVDGDFIATETFMHQAALARGAVVGAAELRDRLTAYLIRLDSAAQRTGLNLLRTEIRNHAVSKAGEAPGFFTLTVPTGGGKTLTSLAFALEHAVQHRKRRVVVVIPFTAIIEQTAQVYRNALGSDDVVLEHHASFDWEAFRQRHDDAGDELDGFGRLRRAAENWDYPIVVTTAVQFFESLYANRTSRCRKLHNLADSVIVLDEAQATPLPVLLPCMAALDELQRGYGASVVLCTATQPAWRKQDGALIRRRADRGSLNMGLDIPESRELAPHPRQTYEALRRVRVEVSPDPVDDAALAEAFLRAPQMLCIVNSRAHARAVFERIADIEGAVHLSTLMCPAHRRCVLDRLRQRLHEGQPVRLVSTSLIEAGVDISFPEVWRAVAGIDSIAQAGGRCNRDGELLPSYGRLVVFTPAEAKSPTAIRAFEQAASAGLRDFANPLSLDAIGAYFRELYFQKGAEALDATMIDGQPGVLKAINEADGVRAPFASIAEAFRLIDDAMQPLLVPWDDRAVGLLRVIGATEGRFSGLLRDLQSYVVAIPAKARADLLHRGVLVRIRHELGESVLRLDDMQYYRDATGLDLSDGAYRTAEENII